MEEIIKEILKGESPTLNLANLLLISGFYSTASSGIISKWQKPLPRLVAYIKVASGTETCWDFFGTGICSLNFGNC